MLFTAISILNT